MDKWVHYFPIYERHFGKFVNRPVVFMEIGVMEGGSLQMWKRYLGPFAQIIGLDINPSCKALEEEQIKIYIGNQADTGFLQYVVDDLAEKGLRLDAVLDDGSHIMSHVCTTFNFLYKELGKNGVYLVEDLHTAYMDMYEGGLNRQGTFIELSKALIDSINARYSGLDTNFANSTFSMSFYDSVVAFEKTQWLEDSLRAMKIP
jgi:hypothetical protein